MKYVNQQGVTLVKLLILIAAFGLVIGGSFLLLNYEKAKTRDAKRLSDMARIQAAFEFLYNDTVSYMGAAQDGCSQAGMLVNQCNLGQYISSIKSFRDPGQQKYIVSQVPSENSYVISFTLEKSYAGLRAGQHTLDPQGIH